jgi:DNA gyrase/topoisomerase IV subunit B
MAKTYKGAQIKVLDPIAHMRSLPGMYVGETNEPNHLFSEIFSNSLDEHLSGHGNLIEVELPEDGSWIRVRDHARGIPVDMTEEGIPGVRAVFTKLFSGGKFEAEGYDIRVGLHGVGLSAVGALSTEVLVTIYRDGYIWTESYCQGKVLVPLKKGAKTTETGTEIKVTVDPAIWTSTKFSHKFVQDKLSDASYLLPTCTFKLLVGELERTYKTTGIGDFVHSRIEEYTKTKNADRLHNPVLLTGKHEKSQVDLSFCFTNASAFHPYSFVNCLCTIDGGTHEAATKKVFFKALQAWPEADKYTCALEDLQEGCFLAVHLRTPDVAFSSQTKEKFVGKKATTEIVGALEPVLAQWVRTNDDALKRIFTLAQQRAAARKQSSKLEQAAAKISTNDKLERGSIKGVVDCQTTNVEGSEIFLLEGQSASGSARMARDPKYQAIVALKGKPINAYRSELEDVLANNEIRDILNALGCGYGRACDPKKLRYGAVYILADADPDGLHIASLLLSFFTKYLRPVVDTGRIRVIDGPIYCAKKGKDREYFYTLDAAKKKLGNDFDKWNLTRFKGWGEASADDLRHIAMNPATRKSFKISATLDTNTKLEELMGSDSAVRKSLLES